MEDVRSCIAAGEAAAHLHSLTRRGGQLEDEMVLSRIVEGVQDLGRHRAPTKNAVLFPLHEGRSLQRMHPPGTVPQPRQRHSHSHRKALGGPG